MGLTFRELASESLVLRGDLRRCEPLHLSVSSAAVREFCHQDESSALIKTKAAASEELEPRLEWGAEAEARAGGVCPVCHP